MTHNMKKIILSLLAIAAMTSCTKSSEEEIDPNAPVEIKLNAGIEALARSVVTGSTFPTSENADLFRVTVYKGTTVPTSDYDKTYFDNAVVQMKSSQLSFAESRYYPTNATEKLYFYAFTKDGINAEGDYTVGTTSDAPSVKYTIDGTQDIMSAKVIEGFTKNSTKDLLFSFSHQLMRVQFLLKKGEGFDDTKKITKITINSCKTNPALDVIAGTLDWTKSSTTSNLDAYSDATGKTATAEGVSVGDIMIQPLGTINITVTAGNITYDALDVNLSEGNANKINVVTLTFSAKSVTPTASIVDWDSTPGSGSGTLQ